MLEWVPLVFKQMSVKSFLHLSDIWITTASPGSGADSCEDLTMGRVIFQIVYTLWKSIIRKFPVTWSDLTRRGECRDLNTELVSLAWKALFSFKVFLMWSSMIYFGEWTQRALTVINFHSAISPRHEFFAQVLRGWETTAKACKCLYSSCVGLGHKVFFWTWLRPFPHVPLT